MIDRFFDQPHHPADSRGLELTDLAPGQSFTTFKNHLPLLSGVVLTPETFIADKSTMVTGSVEEFHPKLAYISGLEPHHKHGWREATYARRVIKSMIDRHNTRNDQLSRNAIQPDAFEPYPNAREYPPIDKRKAFIGRTITAFDDFVVGRSFNEYSDKYSERVVYAAVPVGELATGHKVLAVPQRYQLKASSEGNPTFYHIKLVPEGDPTQPFAGYSTRANPLSSSLDSKVLGDTAKFAALLGEVRAHEKATQLIASS